MFDMIEKPERDIWKTRIQKLGIGDSVSRSLVLPEQTTIAEIKKVKAALQAKQQSVITNSYVDRDTLKTYMTVDVNNDIPLVIHTIVKIK